MKRTIALLMLVAMFAIAAFAMPTRAAPPGHSDSIVMIDHTFGLMEIGVMNAILDVPSGAPMDIKNAKIERQSAAIYKQAGFGLEPAIVLRA